MLNIPFLNRGHIFQAFNNVQFLSCSEQPAFHFQTCFKTMPGIKQSDFNEHAQMGKFEMHLIQPFFDVSTIA